MKKYTKLCLMLLLIITVYLGIILFTSYYVKDELCYNLIIIISTILLIISCFIGLYYEINMGYYVCSKCNHEFNPKYKDALFSMHIFTTRYLKCPKCNKRGWDKLIIK